MTNFTPPFPPAPPPDHVWPDLTVAERKAWYEERHRAFFAAWAAFVAPLHLPSSDPNAQRVVGHEPSYCPICGTVACEATITKMAIEK